MLLSDRVSMGWEEFRLGEEGGNCWDDRIRKLEGWRRRRGRGREGEGGGGGKERGEERERTHIILLWTSLHTHKFLISSSNRYFRFGSVFFCMFLEAP